MFAPFFYACVHVPRAKYIAEELERTQEIINDYPDSALHSLQAIVPGSIRKNRLKHIMGCFIRWRWIKQDKP